ncbi:hypothetical protein QP157_20845 [Sphingomonas sp. LR61]|uniref:hypothetical protein n=1 Tax=Sphingomonas sp. LR61 TaxID=3050234 RepID=UPI002FE3155D
MDKFLSDPAGRLYRFLAHCEQENPNDSILEGGDVILIFQTMQAAARSSVA